MVLGIDLGTSNTLIASINRDGQPFLISDLGKNIFSNPSILSIDNSVAVVSNLAKDYLKIYPSKHFITNYKRSFGTSIPVYIDSLNNKWFSETIAAIIIKKVIFDAKITLSDSIESLVITVPAHFNDLQRKSVLNAAKLANVQVASLIEEPVAAAISYLDNNELSDEILLIYDFGGGTFDITILTNTNKQIFVIAKDGLSNLGGKEFDDLIANKIKIVYEEVFNCNFPGDHIHQKKLTSDAELIKIKLCENKEFFACWLTYDNNFFEYCISINELEAISQEIISKTEKLIFRCLKSVGLTLQNINKFIMVGGTSNIPFLQKYWSSKISENQKLILHNPLNSIALGAAIYAGTLIHNNYTNAPLQLHTVSSFNIAFIINQTLKKEIIIQKNTPLPVSVKRIIKTHNVDILEMKILQFWDIDDEFSIGSLFFKNIKKLTEVEFILSYKVDGTIGINLLDFTNGKELKFDFKKEQSSESFNFENQKKLLDYLSINNIY